MRHTGRGFTLIELSIVLVIIGLIVGGVLVGRDLISAAEVRATIAQVEKYSTAANTFRGKYGQLPGDIRNPDAPNFGFLSRGAYGGEGDGNGVIEGIDGNVANDYSGTLIFSGEEAMFWVDLSTARLIEGGFKTAVPTSSSVPVTNPALYIPEAKVGKGNYIYVWSGGYGIDKGAGNGGSGATTGPGGSYSDTYLQGLTGSNGSNYFGLSAVSGSSVAGGDTDPGLTVSQAYAIDKKVDDGFPQSGAVTAMYPNYLASYWILWAQGPPHLGNNGYISAPNSGATATSGSATTCYDNAGQAGLNQTYSLSQNNSNINCALSFRFQ